MNPRKRGALPRGLKGLKKLLSLLHIPKIPTHSAPSFAKEDPTPTSTLEFLPIELKLSILSWIPDLKSLRNLIHASPSYYKAYISSATKIVSAILHRELSPSLLIEAQTLIKSKNIPRDESRSAVLAALLDEHKTEKAKTKLKIENNARIRIEDESLLAAAKLHLLIQELAQEFCAETLAVHPVTNETISEPAIVSEMEIHRAQRALYRFESFGILFAEIPFQVQNFNFDGEQMSHLYLSAFKPWEVEELACVRDWLYRVYGSVLLETEDLVQEMDLEVERDELRCFMREGREMEDRARRQVLERHQYWKAAQIETLLVLGLPFLSKILKASEVEEKFELMKGHLIPSFGCGPHFLTEALEVEPLEIFSGRVGRRRRRRLHFEGDEEGRPNAGWVWGRRDADAEGQERYFEVGDDGKRRWGYVIWDEERLEGWGVSWEKPNEGRRRGKWVCREVVRESGRVLPSWSYVADEEATGS